MRIYIKNLNLEIINNIFELFKDYLYKTEIYGDLYTDEGIYQIDEKQIHILNTHDKDIKMVENYYNNFSLIVDPSFFSKDLVYSVQGNVHIYFLCKKYYFKFNKLSQIDLIIKSSNDLLNDMYFETQKDVDINDIFIKKELNEFLSLLN